MCKGKKEQGPEGLRQRARGKVVTDEAGKAYGQPIQAYSLCYGS